MSTFEEIGNAVFEKLTTEDRSLLASAMRRAAVSGGNSVSPPVAEWVGRRLMAVLERQAKEHLRGSLAEEAKGRLPKSVAA